MVVKIMESCAWGKKWQYLIVFFVINYQVESPSNHTSPSSTNQKNKKDKCSKLVIWTSTMSNIRIQKLFIFSLLISPFSIDPCLGVPCIWITIVLECLGHEEDLLIYIYVFVFIYIIHIHVSYSKSWIVIDSHI